MSLEAVRAQVGGRIGPLRESWDVDLAPHPSQVSHARAFARECLGDGDPERRELVALLLSEVVTNAILHGRSRVRVDLSLHGSDLGAVAVLAAVTDGSSRLPRQRPPSSTLESGRGLQILDALSESWGWTEREQGAGKIVWFVVGPGSAGVPKQARKDAAPKAKEADLG